MRDITERLIKKGIKFVESGLIIKRLNSAPEKMELEKTNNGFYLENKEIRIKYVLRYFGGENLYQVSFKDLYPKVSFSGTLNLSFLDTFFGRLLFNETPCEEMSFTTGDLNAFSFPMGEATIKNIGNVIYFSNGDKTYLADPRNKVNAAWFSVGDKVLDLASKKYSLKKVSKCVKL